MGTTRQRGASRRRAGATRLSGRLKVSGPFFEKTGNPDRDNAARNANRAIRSGTRRDFRINARGRKRRRQLFHIEADKYQHLIALAMNDIIRDRAEEGHDK